MALYLDSARHYGVTAYEGTRGSPYITVWTDPVGSVCEMSKCRHSNGKNWVGLVMIKVRFIKAYDCVKPGVAGNIVHLDRRAREADFTEVQLDEPHPEYARYGNTVWLANEELLEYLEPLDSNALADAVAIEGT